VYVSFDDGDHWQSLRLNLPATSIRDLVIHQDDVVVGTHGRSFWILDNITPLRQLSAGAAAAEAHLFAPQLTYRMRRNNNTDTPLPPEEPGGKNPPDGAMLDYFLKSSGGPVALEISDAAGKLVRRFSSVDKPEAVNPDELPIPTYWIRPPQTLPAEPGMHRFVWDLHYPPPDSIQHEFPISAIYRDTPRYPLGPAVLPGKYTVKLTVNGKSYTQPLTIKMDPRVAATQDDLRRQFELESKIVEAMHSDYEALRQARSVRKQLQALKGRVAPGQLADSIAALEKKAADLEGSEGGYGARFLSTAEGRSLARLNVGLNNLLSSVDSADAAPTTHALATFRDVQAALREQLARWEEMKTKDVTALNAQLQQSGLPPLDPNVASVGQEKWQRTGASTEEEP
jgi:hypothetical protein